MSCVGTSSAISGNLLQQEEMSSECLVESCSEAQPEGTGLEKQQGDNAEKEAAEAPCEDNQPAGSCGMQEATPDSGLEPVQSEEKAKENTSVKAREGFSPISVNQERQHRGSASGGAGPVKRCIRRSFPRGFPTCSDPDRERQRRAEEPRGLGPFYFIGGANGAEIVSSYCESRGWKRIYNKHRDDVKLKWCENKSPATYCHFREGEHLVYQIPNNKVLTTKIGLLSSLRQYERVSSKVNHGQGLSLRLKMKEFIPTTFRMDVKEEREAFFAQHEGVSTNESHMWICKPTGLNQGRGIFLLKSQADVAAFRLKLQQTDDIRANGKMHHRQPQAQIVQHYIQRPLLLKGKKFDVRSYLLIACTAPYVVFFCHGYVRLTCDLYDPSSNNLSAHLTNQHMQKKNPLYSQLKEDTVWSMESFNAYVNDSFQVAKGLPRDWVLGAFAKRMQQIMTQCFLAVKSKFDCRLGFFDLIGCDFMVDEDFKVWLLEMNCNPALHTNCIVLKEVIPNIVVETLDLSLEIFNKCRTHQRILPLANQRDFVLLYNKVFPPDSVLACSKSYTHREFNRKSIKKTELKRCKSADNIVPSSSLHRVNVSASGEGRGSLKSGKCHSTSSTPLRFHQNSSSVQGPSHLLSGCNSRTDRNKDPRPRVELKLSKCVVHHYPKDAGDVENSKSMQATMIISLSSPGITSCGFPQTTTPFPPHAGPPPLRGKERLLGKEEKKQVSETEEEH